MKHTILGLTIMSGMFFTYSNIQNPLRQPSSVEDVGVIGPNGDVILFHRQGDMIVVRKCRQYTTLSTTTAEARNNCSGPSTSTHVELFKTYLRNIVSKEFSTLLKPLTEAEVIAVSGPGYSSQEIERMTLELDKINSFIKVYGKQDANLVHKEELELALRHPELRLSALRKINSEIERTVALISDHSKLTISLHSKEKDQFLFNALKSFSPDRIFPCGLTGSVDERIDHCSFMPSSTKKSFVLVSRSRDFKEVYKDLGTGLIWSETLPTKLSRSGAVKFCKESYGDLLGLPDISWKLPSNEDFLTAAKNGARDVLPGFKSYFWTSESKPSFYGATKGGWVFSGFHDVYHVYHYPFSEEPTDIRCVAEH